MQELKLKEYEGSCYLPITTPLKESEFLHHIKSCQPEVKHDDNVICEHNTINDCLALFSNGKSALNKQECIEFFLH